jgi:hypothetical protein
MASSRRAYKRKNKRRAGDFWVLEIEFLPCCCHGLSIETGGSLFADDALDLWTAGLCRLSPLLSMVVFESSCTLLLSFKGSHL